MKLTNLEHHAALGRTLLGLGGGLNVGETAGQTMKSCRKESNTGGGGGSEQRNSQVPYQIAQGGQQRLVDATLGGCEAFFVDAADTLNCMQINNRAIKKKKCCRQR